MATSAGVVVDSTGRKRLRPTLLSADLTLKGLEFSSDAAKKPEIATDNTHLPAPLPTPLPASSWPDLAEHTQQAYGRKAIRRPDQLYLGLEPLGVDKIFYGNTDSGKDLDHSDSHTLAINSSEGYTAQKLYVNARMKYFLRSPQLTFQQDGRKHVGIIAYPDRFSRNRCPVSITIFSKSGDRITASRSNRSTWFKDEIELSSTTLDKDPVNVFHKADPALAPEDCEDAIWEAKQADEKWSNVYGKDDELPLYGDSDSEEDFDPKTLREIEKEADERIEAKERLRSRLLSGEEVKRIIETAIENIVQDWTVKRLPKLQPKGWRMWRKYRRNGRLQEELQSIKYGIDKLEARIINLRQEITGQEWKRSKHVVILCKGLQPSIFHREEGKWRLATLKLGKPPAKPSPEKKTPTVEKPHGQPLQEGNVAEDSDDSMDDFIVEDEPEIPTFEGNICEGRPAMSSSEVIDLTAVEDDPETPTLSSKIPERGAAVSPSSSVDWIEEVDPNPSKTLLMYMVTHAPAQQRQAASNYIRQRCMEAVQRDLKLGFKALLANRRDIRDMDREISKAVMQIAIWRIKWTVPIMMDSEKGIEAGHIKVTQKDEAGYEPFYDALLDCIDPPENVPNPPERSPPPRNRKHALEEDQIELGPDRKRDRHVAKGKDIPHMSPSAKNLEREKEERRRREELEYRYANMGSPSSESMQVIVNPGKLGRQDFVYLNPNFGNGARIKPHQKEGLQFLWREITAQHEGLQGCLLAQTMGLGKTMQVIALLVTLAEARDSWNEKIRQQVPPELREFRTLVLCPPALVNNWWDELLLWVPIPHEKTIGRIRKVSAAISLADRLGEVQAWSNEGGILLMGYNTFKDLVHNRATKGGKTNKIKAPPLKHREHRMVKESLLEGATLVVADEAHEFKNGTSRLNKAMTEFKTKSRIALTGSPLNNHLEEYYTIIEWIAPDYLGSLGDFKAIYKMPILEGLSENSSESQYLKARKTLKALELALDSKIHRANAFVLFTDLKDKTEFLIEVPLTPLQELAYKILIRFIHAPASGEKQQHTVLWSWIGFLKLLCNHPKCYWEKVLAMQARPVTPPKFTTPVKQNFHMTTTPEKKKVRGLNENEDIGLLNESGPKTALSRIAKESKEAFEALADPLDTLSLSNKMHILFEILRFSEEANDKVLVFTHSIPTLEYVSDQLNKAGKTYSRIDGMTLVKNRQDITKNFNEGTVNVCVVSTRAGGVGLNLFGANRVIILDQHFNPMWEQQAVGRSYRIGQEKAVFVYRLAAAGTFEQAIQNQGLFKEQLATRVVDRKNPTRRAFLGAGDYIFEPKHVEQKDLEPYKGKDPFVLDRLLADPGNKILSITPTETFYTEDGIELTAAEEKEAEQMFKDEQVRRQQQQAHLAAEKKRLEDHRAHLAAEKKKEKDRVKTIQQATKP